MADFEHHAALVHTLSPEKQVALAEIVRRLTSLANLEALVLGGSYAQGTQQPASDIDLGLYYFEETPFAIDAVRQVAHAISSDGPPVVTGFYEWGAWVNGGAWLRTAAGKVDFLYRNIDQVQRTIAEAQMGQTTLDYLQQPPYGFRSVIYLAETHICQPLYDPKGIIAQLKQQIASYPTRLKTAIVQNNLWSVEFTLLHARDFAQKGDVYNTVGCLTRALSALTQALFALNETYFISDKRAIETVETFAIRPDACAARVSQILGHPGQTPGELTQTVSTLSALFGDVVEQAENLYRPKYPL